MYWTNRLDYNVLGYAVSWQYPAHMALLEQNYLVQTDGRCCQPVAYVLAHSYAMKSRMEDWVAKLDARLKDTSLTGDRRVGWLLARAQAEEIRLSRPEDRKEVTYAYLAGRGWIEEACLTAQSESVRLLAYKELAVRLASEEQFAAARAQLDKAGQKCSSADSVARLAVWRQEIGQVAAGYESLHQNQTAAAQKGYWDAVRARHQQAVSAGDKAAASRYEQIMSDAGVKP